MDLRLSEEQQLIKETAARYANQALSQTAGQAEDGQYRTIRQHTKALAELGFMGLAIDPEYGGTGAGSVAFSLAITELAKVCASTSVTTSVTNMVAEVIQAVGSEQQKNYYLPKLCSGEFLAGSFCLTESQAGSDPSSMKTRAQRCEGGWRLNGSKQWITSASFAGVMVVWAVTNPDAPRGKGISCFLVEPSSPGVTIGPSEHKMGQHGSATCAVHFDDCFVAEQGLLGELDKGFAIATSELAGGRIGIGSLALGIGLAAMEYATRYARERQQFGKPLTDFQGLQWMIADRATELEAARLLLMSAADLKERGKPFAKQASMAKLFASERANDACYSALQLLGGYGYMSEYPLERFSRDVRITSIYEGTSEVQRLIIARETLREVELTSG